MIQNHLKDYPEDNGAHWGVGHNQDYVLLQIQDDLGCQCRVRLLDVEVERLIGKLQEHMEHRRQGIWP